MTSFVYVIGPETLYPGALVKIGVSTDVVFRLKTFQSGSPTRLAVLWAAPGDEQVEEWLHTAFVKERRHGEWFDLGPSPVEAVQEKLGPFMINISSLLVGKFPITVDLRGWETDGLSNIDSLTPDPDLPRLEGTVIFRQKIADKICELEEGGVKILNAADLAEICMESGRARSTVYDELNRLCDVGRLSKDNGRPPYRINSVG